MKTWFLDVKGCLNGFQTCISTMEKVHAFLISQLEVAEASLSSLRIGVCARSAFP